MTEWSEPEEELYDLMNRLQEDSLREAIDLTVQIFQRAMVHVTILREILRHELINTPTDILEAVQTAGDWICSNGVAILEVDKRYTREHPRAK